LNGTVGGKPFEDILVGGAHDRDQSRHGLPAAVTDRDGLPLRYGAQVRTQPRAQLSNSNNRFGSLHVVTITASR
jgi:hypothetical protein